MDNQLKVNDKYLEEGPIQDTCCNSSSKAKNLKKSKKQQDGVKYRNKGSVLKKLSKICLLGLTKYVFIKTTTFRPKNRKF